MDLRIMVVVFVISLTPKPFSTDLVMFFSILTLLELFLWHYRDRHVMILLSATYVACQKPIPAIAYVIAMFVQSHYVLWLFLS